MFTKNGRISVYCLLQKVTKKVFKMGKFKEKEKIRQAQLKVTTDLFSKAAQAHGMYKKKERDFCLSLNLARENLFPDIRQQSIQYFAQHNIGWHDGYAQQPSNHLCDSQVCCVNFLFPFANQADALKALLKPIYPQIEEMLLIEGENQFVGFEWIGKANYLREKTQGQRTRGKNCTSADAIVVFRCMDGSKQIVLIEWKYTESYSNTSCAISDRGTDRTVIYHPFYQRHDFPLDKKHVVDFKMLFYQPFYQLLRQQLLANEMQIAREMSADRVTVLHIAPQANTDFQKVTSPLLQPLGNRVTNVWHELLNDKSTFKSVATEQLFSAKIGQDFPELSTWWDYISTRYDWLLNIENSVT